MRTQTNGVGGTKACYIESQANTFTSVVSYTMLPYRYISVLMSLYPVISRCLL